MGRLCWDIVGLAEVWRQGEDAITLKSGNLLYYREGEQQSKVVSGSSFTGPLLTTEQDSIPYNQNI